MDGFEQVLAGLEVVNARLAAIAAVLDSPQPATMGKQEAADYLGVSVSSLNRLVADGEIGSTKIGGMRRFRRRELDAFLDEKTIKAKR